VTPVLLEELEEALAEAVRENGWSLPSGQERPALEVPRLAEHGDLATTLPLHLARAARLSPRAVAERLAATLKLGGGRVAAVEVAGPGFLNFRLAPEALRDVLAEILRRGGDYGRTRAGQGLRVQVEFVSANPTGPLNVVNARAAAVGDALVRILRAAGYDAASEFYVNDAGRQVDLLGRSLGARVAERHGRPAALPEDGYQGEYLKDLAAEFPAELVASALAEEDAATFRAWAVERVVAWQRADLERYGVRFDRWVRESELHARRALPEALSLLEARGHVYRKEEAVWFRATAFGDSEDRVLVRANGEPTYFLADIAYHRDKHERGFQRSIDLWGPDHHGHVLRLTAALTALGLPEGFLEVQIVQWVKLLSGGEPVKMSKRAGEFVLLADLVDEVGVDNARYFFLLRSTNAHLDFDLEVAKAESSDNPAYYVQYAHARICSVLRHAAETGHAVPAAEAAPLARLDAPEELDLLRALFHLPQVVTGAARAREPHRVPTYLRGVAESFHRFYQAHRVVSDDAERTAARLALCAGVRQVLRNGLGLLGVSAPERM
jgi:arginyl-tRNA synthetase